MFLCTWNLPVWSKRSIFTDSLCTFVKQEESGCRHHRDDFLLGVRFADRDPLREVPTGLWRRPGSSGTDRLVFGLATDFPVPSNKVCRVTTGDDLSAWSEGRPEDVLDEIFAEKPLHLTWEPLDVEFRRGFSCLANVPNLDIAKTPGGEVVSVGGESGATDSVASFHLMVATCVERCGDLDAWSEIFCLLAHVEDTADTVIVADKECAWVIGMDCTCCDFGFGL